MQCLGWQCNEPCRWLICQQNLHAKKGEPRKTKLCFLYGNVCGAWKKVDTKQPSCFLDNFHFILLSISLPFVHSMPLLYFLSLSLSHSLCLSHLQIQDIYTYTYICRYTRIHIQYSYNICINIYILDCAFSNCMQLCDSRCTFLESRWPWCRNQTKTVHGQCVIKCKHNIQLSNSYI